MKTNTVIWVYGSSAAGKETFIKNIIEKKPEKIIKELGWIGKEILLCRESVEWVGQSSWDKITDKRRDLPQIVSDLLANKENTVVLIKGQDVDLEDGTQICLYEMLPNCEHRVLFLKVGIDKLYERIQRKAWWYPKNSPEDSPETVKKWLNYQMKLLKEISDKLPTTAVDSSTTDYHVVELPPELATAALE